MPVFVFFYLPPLPSNKDTFLPFLRIAVFFFYSGFKPNMYRLMQTTGKTLEMAVNFTKLFHAKRNRDLATRI
jgi:hypothetical protein